MSTQSEIFHEVTPEQLNNLLQQGTLGGNSDSVTLVLSVVGKEKNFNCRLLGEHGPFKLVTMPALNGQPVPVRVGQAAQVKRFDGLSIHVGSYQISRIIFNPCPFLILEPFHEHTAEIKRQIRGAQRVASNIPSEVTDRDNRCVNGLMTDVSMTGCMLILNEPLHSKVGDSITLSAQIEHRGHLHEVNFKGKIVRGRCTELETGSLITVGIQFAPLESFTDLCLSNYIRGEILRVND